MKKLNCLLLFLCLLAGKLKAQTTSLPIMERLFGPTTTNAVAGNTRLTTGFSKYGELVSLRWPSPSHYDQLNYRALKTIPFEKLKIMITFIIQVHDSDHLQELALRIRERKNTAGLEILYINGSLQHLL